MIREYYAKDVTDGIQSHLSKALPFIFEVGYIETIEPNVCFSMYCNGLTGDELKIIKHYLQSHPFVLGVIQSKELFYFYTSVEWAIKSRLVTYISPIPKDCTPLKWGLRWDVTK